MNDRHYLKGRVRYTREKVFRRQRVQRLAMRPFVYHGCKITVMNNSYYSFRYEWRLETLTITPTSILRRKGYDGLSDPTSWRSKVKARIEGKDAAQALKRPYFAYEWNRNA